MTEPTRATTAADGTDIPRGGWVERRLPAPARPYAVLMRLDRPIGTWLLLFPCLWSLAMAARGPADLPLFVLFALGAVIMRGAGCVWNDITDRDFDRQVARTRTRPIASGAVSLPRAFAALALLLLLGLAILLTFNRFAVLIGVASLGLVVVYPLMKRITYWPQLVLGFTFNWGALLGWAAVHGALAWPPLVLYGAGIFWTLGYDTIYAHQDKEDDALIGVRSTALRLGEGTRPWLYGFYATAVLGFAGMGYLLGLGWLYAAFLLAAALQLGWQARRVALDDPADCLAKFRSNRLFGWLVLGGIALDRLAASLLA